MRKVCSNCAKVYEDEAVQFCTVCGSPTIPEQQRVVSLKKDIPLENFCPNCGNTLATDAKFCSQCGKSLDEESIFSGVIPPTPVPIPAKEAAKSPNPLNIILCIVIALFVITLGVVIFAVFALTSDKTMDSSSINAELTTIVSETLPAVENTEIPVTETTTKGPEALTTTEITTTTTTTQETKATTIKETVAVKTQAPATQKQETVTTAHGKYKVYDAGGPITQTKAEMLAEEKGGHLAYIKDAEAFNEIATQANNMATHKTVYVWVGGTTSYYNDDYTSTAGTWFDGTGTYYIDENNLWFYNVDNEGNIYQEPSGIDSKIDSNGNLQIIRDDYGNIIEEHNILMWRINGEWSFNDENENRLVSQTSLPVFYAVEFD